MKEINLTRGLVALVDDKDFEYLNQFSWNALKIKDKFYANRSIYKENNRCVYMHREIMNTPKGMQTDHINHNTLDCQRINLRICTKNENNLNRTPAGKSKYSGVTIRKDGKIFTRIQLNRKPYWLGYHKTEELAAKAYDIKAKELFGEFANLNFK